MTRKAQSYAAYKKSRDRRAAYAARYERDQLRGADLRASEKLAVFASIVIVVLLSPVILAVYLSSRLMRAIRPFAVEPDAIEMPSLADDTLCDEEKRARLRAIVERQTRDREQQELRQSVQDVQTSQQPGWTIKGKTTPEFDGVTLPTLRYWLKFWRDDRRSAGRAEEMMREDPGRYAGRTREDHIRMIEAEITARTSGSSPRQPRRTASGIS